MRHGMLRVADWAVNQVRRGVAAAVDVDGEVVGEVRRRG